MSSEEASFFTITDARFFLGTVALINSLRLSGHSGPITLLDCGLLDSQRELLRAECRLLPFDRTQASNPLLFKPFAYLTKPSGTVTILDSDMIVTRSLDPLLALAENGRICVFPDPEASRWFAEWQQLYQLRASPRRQTYVNSGFVMFSTTRWPQLLELWWQACQRGWSRPTLYEGAADHPTSQGDQDALNAVLMTELPTDALAVQHAEEAPAVAGYRNELRIVDARTLACTCQGRPTTILHYSGAHKPWDTTSWPWVRNDAYVRLMHRLLLGSDVTLKIPRRHMPFWLRTTSGVPIQGLDLANRTARAAIGRALRPTISRFVGQRMSRVAH